MGWHYPAMFRGDKMRTQREALGITRAELARMLEESESMLGRWERGEHEPRVGSVVKIARKLRLSLDDLIDEDHEKAPPSRRG